MWVSASSEQSENGGWGERNVTHGYSTLCHVSANLPNEMATDPKIQSYIQR
jgi:hypothetical protein